MTIDFLSQNPVRQPKLKVVGVGGGGCNATDRMIELGLHGVEFIAANTDNQALQRCLAPYKILLGPKTTRGLGAGSKPEIGHAAAEESYNELVSAMEGADMVFLTAGMGGGTGTGAVPVLARIAQLMGIVTIAIVTTPFSFEMGRRQRNATEGLNELRPHTNTLITIPNDRLLYVAPKDLPMDLSFRMADDVLRQAVQGITELITEPGLINVDFAHIERLMKMGGGAVLSIGYGQGQNKSLQAIEQALHHPLLDPIPLENAAGVIVNITASKALSIFELSEALTRLQEKTGSNSEIVMGVTHDERMEDRAQVILIITGIGASSLEEVMRGTSARTQPTPVIERPVSVNHVPELVSVEMASTMASSLDLPAFLRRRTYNSSQTG